MNLLNYIDDIEQELLILNWKVPSKPERNAIRAMTIVLNREKKWARQNESIKDKPDSAPMDYSSMEFLLDPGPLLSKIPYIERYILWLVAEYGLREAATRLYLSHTSVKRIIDSIEKKLFGS